MKYIIEEIVKKWETIGLINHLEGEFKELVAFIYETIAYILTNEVGEFERNKHLEQMIFPAVNKILIDNKITKLTNEQKIHFSYNLINYMSDEMKNVDFDNMVYDKENNIDEQIEWLKTFCKKVKIKV